MKINSHLSVFVYINFLLKYRYTSKVYYSNLYASILLFKSNQNFRRNTSCFTENVNTSF